MELIYSTDLPFGEKVRIVKSVFKKRDAKELIWKIQLLYLEKSEWVQICRADNYPHEGKPGSHIHEGKQVRYQELGFSEATSELWNIAKKRIFILYNYDIGELI